jgi:hypothetical protein
MNLHTKKFVVFIFLITNYICASSEEHKSTDAQQLISNFAQLQIIDNRTQVTGNIITIATCHDYDQVTEHYSSGDHVTTICTGPDGIREIYIARTGKTYRTFFAKNQQA